MSSDWAYQHIHPEKVLDPHPPYVSEYLFNKGRIITGIGSGVIQAQSTGADGYGLTAASTETTGLAWAAVASAGFTEARGATTLIGNSTNRWVYHYLGQTPDYINVTMMEQGGADYGRWWVSAVDSTRFTLYVTASPTTTTGLDFYWHVRKM
jgi:hypothetical protein